jgi:hypothetical protein
LKYKILADFGVGLIAILKGDECIDSLTSQLILDTNDCGFRYGSYTESDG